ncbi:MAG: LPS export ABC transporter periplasmic protein LptC [Proteobacteria bacterium]|nr:MAG: LPS export ABC transporter periplasmic protein LptC [Pseudomonadota bacterium]
MSRRNGIIIALLFVILVIEIVIVAPKELGTSVADDLAAAKRARESSRAAKNSDKGQSGQVMNDVHLVEAAGEGKEWELWADRALRPKDKEQWTIEKVKVHFFADNGVMYTVTGDRGQVVPEKKDIRIDGNVVTRSTNGYVFKTQSVDYNSKARKLDSPNAVEMIGPKDQSGGELRLNGGALMAEFDTNLISITKGVRAKRKVNVGKDQVPKTANIQANRAEFSGKTNEANFYGDVVIDVETMQLAGPQAKFAYDAKSQMLNSVKIAGGAKVSDTDKFATSGVVDLFFKEDRVVFSGSPRVVQNGDELVGDEIVLMDGGKKVQVSNAKAQLDPERSSETGTKQ